MDLYLLRHGIAEELSSSDRKPDSERVLTAEGARKMRRIAKGMKATGLSFDLILSSPLPRARQTAEIAAQAYGLRRSVEMTPNLAPQGDPRRLMDELNERRARCKTVLLVGHEPYLSRLISQLVAGDDSLSLELKKGGLGRLSARKLRYGRCATLNFLLTPRQLRSLA
jgi:phosphohistidine phosphatase